MEKRAVIAVALSIAVYLVFSYFFPPPPQGGKGEPVAQQRVSSARQVVPAVAASPAPAPTVAAAQEVTVDTPLFTAVFTSRGGELKRFVLKRYTEKSAGGGNIVLFNAADDRYTTLETSGNGISVDPNAVYAVEKSSLHLEAAEKGEIAFTWTSPAGLTVVKKYSFAGDSYRFGLDTTISNGSATPLAGTIRTDMLYRLVPTDSATRFEMRGPVAYADGKFIIDNPKESVKPSSLDTGVMWAGFSDKYFLQVGIEEKGNIAAVKVDNAPEQHVRATLVSPPVNVSPGTAVTVPASFFFGPKDLDILKAQGKHLEEAIDLGWFAALAKPLLKSLKFFYQYTHNYGIAIIIITVILKVLFYPLTYKSYKSMKEMQKLQPKMTALREKYKNDREKMNMEVMKMYQEHKVNPLGGCLPMLVQIPVFFALYKALMFSIELRHAPFMLWITDLAGKDPYYVTPIIMGATMFIQQKMTPSQMDPIQQKMMMALPVVFTFMFLNFPSGLVLYWLVNNVLTIGQQYYINKKLA